MRRAIFVFMLCLAPLAQAESLAIVGGTVHPITAEPFVGNVLIEAGVITAVGANVAVPEIGRAHV